MPTPELRTPGRLFLAGSLSGPFLCLVVIWCRTDVIGVLFSRCNIRLYDVPIGAHSSTVSIPDEPTTTYRRRQNYISGKPPSHHFIRIDRIIINSRLELDHIVIKPLTHLSDTNSQPFHSLLSWILRHRHRDDSLRRCLLSDVRHPRPTYPAILPLPRGTQDLVRPSVRGGSGCRLSNRFLPL
jgi:hypothetical protein